MLRSSQVARRGAGVVRRAARRRREASGPGGVILMYHRVAHAPHDPWELCVTPEHFGAHLAALAERCPLVDLGTVVGGGAGLPSRWVALSLDDAYADTLTAALPAVERRGVPLAVYVTTGGFDGRSASWWDVLAEILLSPGEVPSSLELEIGGRTSTWGLAGATVLDPATVEAHRGWRADDPPPTRRHQVYLEVWRALIERPEADQQSALDQMRAWAAADGVPPGRLLTAGEARELGDHPLVTVGAHTEHHQALDTLDDAPLTEEVEGSRARLEEAVGRPVEHLAYPYGRSSPGVMARVRSAGFLSAATTDRGRVDPHTDRFALPRVAVPDLPGPEFARWLDQMSPP